MKKAKDKNTESKILEAAKNIFQTKGMDGARMQEIADKAGINKAMLHYYFRSKQLLFEAVYKNAFLMLAPQLNKILNSDLSLNDKIKGFTKNYISFIIKHPYLPSFIITELNRSPEFVQKFTSEKHFPNIEKFKQQVTENVENGSISPIKPEQLFINIMALNIFPFVAAPLLKGFLAINNKKDYQLLMEERVTEVSNFIINAIKIRKENC